MLGKASSGKTRWNVACGELVAACIVPVCMTPSAALANDSTFGGAPADLVPLAEQQVRMLSEDIVLTASDTDWQIEARYQFQNLADKDVTVQVGFPEFRCPRDIDSDCADAAFRDLVTRVDGVAVKHRQGKLSKKHGWANFLGVVWLFDVTFPVGRPLAVTHRYRLATGGDLSGVRYTGYVTRTGRSWAGTIGHATFTAVFPPFVRAIQDVDAPGLRATPPRLVLDAGSPRIELRLEGKDWKPEGGVFFSYNASSNLTLEPIDVKKYAGDNSIKLFPFEHCPLSDASVDAQSCLNDLYASRGYPFKNPVLHRKYYSGNPAFRRVAADDGTLWVRDASPLATFTTDWFDGYDRAGLKQWTELLTQQRAAQAGAAEGSASALGELPLPAVVLSSAGGASAGGLPSPAAAPSPVVAPSAVLEERHNRAEPVAAGSVPEASTPSSAATPAAAAPSTESKAASGCGLRRAPASRRVDRVVLTLSAALFGARLRRRRRRAPPAYQAQ